MAGRRVAPGQLAGVASMSSGTDLLVGMVDYGANKCGDDARHPARGCCRQQLPQPHVVVCRVPSSAREPLGHHVRLLRQLVR